MRKVANVSGVFIVCLVLLGSFGCLFFFLFLFWVGVFCVCVVRVFFLNYVFAISLNLKLKGCFIRILIFWEGTLQFHYHLPHDFWSLQKPSTLPKQILIFICYCFSNMLNAVPYSKHLKPTCQLWWNYWTWQVMQKDKLSSDIWVPKSHWTLLGQSPNRVLRVSAKKPPGVFQINWLQTSHWIILPKAPKHLLFLICESRAIKSGALL